MGKTGTVKHTHQYFRRTDGLWACSGRDEGCTHYMPKNMHPLPIGRKSICWSCESEFQLLPSSMKKEKPTCDKCTDELSVIGKWLEEKMPESDPVMRAFDKAAVKAGVSIPMKEEVKPEDDMIEVYEPEHRADCNVFSGGECNCM